METQLISLSATQLRRAAELKERIEALQSELAGMLGNRVAARTGGPARRGKISAAGLARIRAAQRARWAAHRAGRKTAPLHRRRMSPAARARLAAIARARWAKVKARGGRAL